MADPWAGFSDAGPQAAPTSPRQDPWVGFRDAGPNAPKDQPSSSARQTGLPGQPMEPGLGTPDVELYGAMAAGAGAGPAMAAGRVARAAFGALPNWLKYGIASGGFVTLANEAEKLGAPHAVVEWLKNYGLSYSGSFPKH